MKRLLLGILVAFGAMCAWCEGGMSEDTVVSNRIRLEGRTSVGGRLLNGNERISPVAERANPNAKLTIDGTVASGWRVAEPEFDSTTLTDGWKTFALNEGASTAEVELLALNNPAVAIHGGALEADETWSSDRIHIVRNWVRIPEDMTLTIEEGTIVKFCEATGIQNDGTLIATGATFTSIEDDSVGGDTDMNGENGALAYGVYFFTGSGKRVMTDCDVRYSANLPVSTRWAAGSVNHIYGTLTVGSGVTLTIEPGAIVKLATNAELTAENGGSIVANGVLFTHIADDSEEAGGDTNGDGDATVPVHDAYKLTGFTPAADCELRYITLTFAGGTISDTMTLEGNRVHKVTGDITVASGGKLIVQPGAIVKMEAGLSITIQSGGTLEAIGNRAQTIVFTSIKDDVHGGDTNGDESKTIPQPGDWRQISVLGGTLNLAFTQIYYCGIGSSMNDAIYMSSGEATLNGCIIAHVTQYVAGLDGGTWMMRNSMFYDFDTAFRHFGSNSNINCVFYDFGNLTNNGSMSFTNCVIAKYSKALLWTSWGNESSDSSSYKNCVIWNPAGFGPQSSVKANSNGNIWADPLFTDPDNGDFTLKAGSPCIDAGDGGVAPEKDYWGKPRMDVVKVADSGKPDADGVCPDIGIFEMPGSYTGCCANLAVNAVTGPAEASSGERFTINWTVTNEGNAEAVGPWRDVIFLQGADEALGGQVVELGEYTVTGTLEPLASREVTAQFTLPPLKPGNWRIGITTNSYRDVYEVKRTDNQAFSEETLEVALPVWSADNNRFAVPARGELGFALEASEEARIVTIAVPEGATMEAFAATGYLPSAESSDAVAVRLSDGRLLLVVPATETASYITLTNGGETAATATVSVAALELSLLEAMPAQILNRGNATIRIIGTGLSKESVFTLNMGAATVTGETIALENGLVASVQFTVDGIAPGEYTLSVAESGKTTTLAGKITVTADGVGPKLEAWLETPANVRDGRIYTAWLCYKNSGDADMTMPLFEVSCNASTKISYTVDGEYASRPLRYAGISPTAPAGVLKAGDEHRVPIFFTLVGRYQLKFATIDCNDKVHDTFGTWREYGEAMAKAATRLNARGKEEYRGSILFEKALLMRQGLLKCAISGVVRDQMTGEAIPGTTVNCQDREGLLQTTTVTDADGWFVLEGVDNGILYSLQAIDCFQEEAFQIATPSEGEAVGIVLPVRARAAMHGWVLAAEDEMPLADVWVTLTGTGLSDKNTSDEEGHFSFVGVLPGDYQLRVESSHGYVGGVQAITVKDDDRTVSVTLKLRMGGILRGKVALQEDRTPLPGVQVVATEAATGECLMCETDDEGLYLFDGLTVGRHWLSLGSEKYQLAARTSVAISENRDSAEQELDLVAIPMAPLMVVPSRGAAPLNVSSFVMDETLRETGTGWEWDFDGDGVTDSTEMDATWTYMVAGEYDITLRYVDQDGNPQTMTRRTAAVVREPVETIVRQEVVLLNESQDYALVALTENTVTLRRLRDLPDFQVQIGSVLVYGTEASNAFYRVVTAVMDGSGTADEVMVRTRDARLDEVLEQCDMTFVAEASEEQMRGGDDWNGVTADVSVLKAGLKATPRVKPIFEQDIQLRKGYLGIHFAAGMNFSLVVEHELSSSIGINLPLFKKKIGELRKDWVFMAGPVPVWVDALDKLDFVVKLEAKGGFKASLKWKYEMSGKYGIDFNTDDGFSSISERSSDFNLYEPEIGFDGSLKISVGLENELKCEVYGGLLKLKAGVEGAIWGRLGKAPDDVRWKFSTGWSLRAYAGISALYSESKLTKWLKLDLSLLKYECDLGYIECPWREWYAAMPEFSRIPLDDIQEGDTVQFFDESIKGDEGLKIKAWIWNLGDGTEFIFDEDDYKAAFTHEYEAQGCYVASLRLKSSFLSYNGKYEDRIVVGELEDEEEAPETLPKDDEDGISQQSCDPNEIAGMTGYGDHATQRFVKPGEWVDYTVFFENKSTAAAAAQEVTVTQQLSKYLDWGTLELGEIAFNNQIQLELKGKKRGTATVNQNGATYQVKMTASLDEATGKFELYLRSYDKTRQAYGYWPESVYAGFLPPNDDTHAGEGHFTFRVKVHEGAPDGVMIPAEATIVFDKNAPITTSPAWFNWVNADETLAETGVLTWDSVEGASYEVSIWSGDADVSSDDAVATANSGLLAESRWRIPDGLTDGTTYFWRVTTTDAEGNVTQSPVWSFELGGRFRYELLPGWNLVSVPFEPDAYSARQMMVSRKPFTLDNDGYVKANALEAGRAYWIFQRSLENRYGDLLSLGTRTQQSMELHNGWNLVGATETDAILDDTCTVWRFTEGVWQLLEPDDDGHYRLEAGQGYFIYQPAEEEP